MANAVMQSEAIEPQLLIYKAIPRRREGGEERETRERKR